MEKSEGCLSFWQIRTTRRPGGTSANTVITTCRAAAAAHAHSPVSHLSDELELQQQRGESHKSKRLLVMPASSEYWNILGAHMCLLKVQSEESPPRLHWWEEFLLRFFSSGEAEALWQICAATSCYIHMHTCTKTQAGASLKRAGHVHWQMCE